jgi:polysaccharide chain length determinant protein (PEP-CTERM system associated)
MATEYQLTLSDYLSIMRRRAIYLIGIFTVVFLIAVVVAIVIPPTYRATGTIIVESQPLPDNVVPTAIKQKLDDQINAIMQRMLTRENLLQLANKHRLSNGNIGTQSSSGFISQLRQRIFIETDSSKGGIRTNQQGQQTIAFTLSFEDRDSDTAFYVTKDLIALFLDLNAKLRNEGAIDATAFLTQESDKLKVEVDKLEQSIAEYKQLHKNALPEQLTLRMTMLSRAENDLREIERDSRTAKDEIRTLEVELAAAKRGEGSGENPSQTLPALKAELARLSSVYSESHPDIRRLKRKIETMEKPADTPVSATDSAEIPSLAVYRIQAKIDSNKARLNSLAQQRDMLQSKIAQNESAMIQTPKVGQELDVLIRDRDVALKKFEEFRSKRMNAKIAENLESENKSGNFSVLEPPVLPEKPFKPNRVKILLIGFFLALASAAGVVTGLELINQRIRGTEALTHVAGSRPLAVIPYISVEEDDIRRKHMIRMLKQAIVIVTLTLIASIVALHFLYMPVDTLFIKILSRFG